MNADEKVNERLNDYKEILFGLEYNNLDGVPKEEYRKIVRCALLFSNQVIVICTKEYRDLELEIIKILNNKLESLK